MNNITYTRYTSPEPLSKRYWTDKGLIQKQAAAQMTKGTAERVTMPFADFPQALAKATNKQAFGYGQHSVDYPDKVSLVVSGKEQPDKNIIARTKDYIQYNGAGVAMIDSDPNEYGPVMSSEQLIQALIQIHPAIAQAARVERGSVSAGVHKTGEIPRTDKGFHVYIPVKNAADIPRYGKVVFDRLWQNGCGFIALASNGALLVRTVIDGAVFSPERLDFVGTPIISSSDLEYIPPQTTYVEGGLLDTESLPDLTDEQKATVERMKAKAKEAIKPAAEEKQKQWASAKIETMRAAGVPVEKAREVINRILRGGYHDLYDDFLLEFAGELGTVSVADVFKNLKKYHDKSLADPVEGTAYGATTAKFYANQGGKHVIHSLAHGQDTSYFLHLTPPAQKAEWDDPYIDFSTIPDDESHLSQPSKSLLIWEDGDEMADNATAPEYLINDILETDSHGILAGASQAFKTFADLRMVYSISTGNDFFGHKVFTTGKVLYVCGEGRGALKRRLKALKIVEGDFKGNLCVLDYPLRIDHPVDMAMLRQAIETINPVLVVFDTFASLVSVTDENCPSEVGRALRLIKETCRHGKTSSLIIHHYGKDATKGPRGASNFGNDVDFCFEMVRVPDTMLTTLSCKKMKDGEDFDDIYMQAHVVELGIIRQDGKIATSLVLKPTNEKPDTGKKGNPLDSLHTKILTALYESINEYGIQPPQEIILRFPDSPQNCPKKVVHIKDFRLLAYPHLNVQENSKRTTLKRCVERLEDNNKCTFYNGYLW